MANNKYKLFCIYFFVVYCFNGFCLSSAYGTSFAVKSFLCPYCGRIFSDKIPISTNLFGGKDSEFRVYAIGGQSIPFFIHTCPGCGSPDRSSLFNPTDKIDEMILTDQEKEKIGNFLTYYREKNKVVPAAFTYDQKYEVVANILALLARPSYKIAASYLYAAWMADDEGRSAKSKIYRGKSIEYFKKSLDNNEITGEQAQIVTYLIGELYRRIELFNKAIEWLSKVKAVNPQLNILANQQRKLALQKDSNKKMLTDLPKDLAVKDRDFGTTAPPTAVHSSLPLIALIGGALLIGIIIATIVIKLRKR